MKTFYNNNNYKIGEKNAWLGIISNILLFIVKILAGIFGRSQAMIADAMHTASDALTSVAVVIGFKIAQEPPDEHHPFGHGRAESIAAKIVSIVLILVGADVAYNSGKVLFFGEIPEPGYIAVIAAIISIIVKEYTYRIVFSAGTEINSTSLKADACHHRSDAISSIAALIGILGAKIGQGFMDPLAGIVVAGFIIKMGFESFHVAYDELMDASPPAELKDKIEKAILDLKNVIRVKKIGVRKTGIEFFIEVTIGVAGEKTVKEGHIVTIEVKRAVLKNIQGVRDVTVHVEPE